MGAAWLAVVTGALPPDVQGYLDGIAPEHRVMWDRVERIVRELHPDVELRITYEMPTFVVGDRRLPVGVWKHGPTGGVVAAPGQPARPSPDRGPR